MYTRDVMTGMQFVCITLPLGIKAQSQQHDKRTESLSCWWGESAQRCQIIMVDYTQQSIWRDQIFGWGECFFFSFFLSCVHMIDVATADDKNVRLSIINFCHKWWISLLLKQDNINGEGMKTKREEVVPKAKHLSTNSFTHLAFLALSSKVQQIGLQDYLIPQCHIGLLDYWYQCHTVSFSKYVLDLDQIV